ncbi:MAG: hypothetical protein EBU29_12770, partial [Gammaproteobacteria bacterium]|nr:hypothetical protein [Gammaproteobacteria bacterium]
ASGGPAEGQSAGGQPGTGGDGKSADDLYARLRADLSEEIEEGLAEVERDGDKVIVRLADQGSFASGSADLQSSFLPLLRRTGQALTQGDGKISVNGHTDNVPILFNDRFNSNWDLSAARAAAVADFLLDEFPANPASMTISGFADSKPIADNGTPQGRCPGAFDPEHVDSSLPALPARSALHLQHHFGPGHPGGRHQHL